MWLNFYTKYSGVEISIFSKVKVIGRHALLVVHCGKDLYIVKSSRSIRASGRTRRRRRSGSYAILYQELAVACSTVRSFSTCRNFAASYGRNAVVRATLVSTCFGLPAPTMVTDTGCDQA